jgi:hypothetical protein
VQVLAHGVHSAGTHQVWWDGRSAPPGLYFVRLALAGQTRIRRVVITR